MAKQSESIDGSRSRIAASSGLSEIARAVSSLDGFSLGFSFVDKSSMPRARMENIEEPGIRNYTSPGECEKVRMAQSDPESESKQARDCLRQEQVLRTLGLGPGPGPGPRIQADLGNIRARAKAQPMKQDALSSETAPQSNASMLSQALALLTPLQEDQVHAAGELGEFVVRDGVGVQIGAGRPWRMARLVGRRNGDSVHFVAECSRGASVGGGWSAIVEIPMGRAVLVFPGGGESGSGGACGLRNEIRFRVGRRGPRAGQAPVMLGDITIRSEAPALVVALVETLGGSVLAGPDYHV